MARCWRSRGRRIGKRTIVTAEAGSTETIKRGRRARKEARRNDSEERNRVAIVDPETHTNSRVHAKIDCDAHTKIPQSRDNAKNNSQENCGGKGFP